MSLVYNWENECEKWGFNYPVKMILGSIEERTDLIRNIKKNQKELYITSYDSLRRDITLYDSEFRFVIADEAQFIKNQFAQKSEAIKALNSEINFALTGTPIENGLADLWSIFDFLMPGYLSNYSHFKSRYESLIVHDDLETLDNLKKRVSPFILRRTKKDVLKDLPDKIEDYYYCKMEDKQKEVYDLYVEKLKDDLKAGGNNVLALLTRLRQVCITPELIYQEPFTNTKIDMAIDLIKSSIESGHRILLFSQFAQSFPILSRELDNMGIKHFILDGQTKAKLRMEMVDEFNKNEDIKLFIISLKAGGTGLNLTGADMVIHLDPWWNSSAEMQATDRTYRIGQTKNVTVIKLICKDTIEEKVIHLQKLKRELAESIVIEDEKKAIKLTKQDILELLE
jgi:SNF2 family DNA or RNA helicase